MKIFEKILPNAELEKLQNTLSQRDKGKTAEAN